MFKKFLALFTWRKSSDSGVTPNGPAPWPDLAGSNRRIQPERIAPFGTGTPHDRMHGLIASGKPDALIAIELGVDISAVRNYRHIISARGRVPAALLRRAEELEDRVRQNETFGARAASSPLYDPDLSQAITSQGCALVSTMLDELARSESQCPAPCSDISSGSGGDFGGAGATGSFSND